MPILLVEILIAVLFATSLHFIMGPGGMHSFGHAAYFGLGAYGAALFLKVLNLPMEAALLLGPLLALGGALVFGWFCVRLSGVYLAMLTLAFAQIVWSVVFQWDDVTGGSNGVLGLWPSNWLSSPVAYYYLTLACVAVCVWLLRRMLFSPLGYAMRASRDSGLRAEAIGIDVKRVQWASFVIASVFCGLAGSLYAFSKGTISPEVISVSRSVDGLVMVLLGGLQTLTGPIVGAAVFTWLQDTVARQTDYWQALLGFAILLLVIAFPQGIVGFIRDRFGDDDFGTKNGHAGGRRGRAPQCAFTVALASDRHEGGSMSLLRVSGLSKSFGGLKAVDDVSFDLEAGQLLALLGPNGAGKSTCFNMVNGQLRPSSGSIRLDDHELVGMRPRDIWRLGVGRTFQIAATFNSMTVLENVQMALVSRERKLFGLWKPAGSWYADEAFSLLEQVGMARRRASCLRRAGLWRRQARRTRHRHGEPSEAAADGRTDRRHGAEGAQRTDGTNQAPRHRAQNRRVVHRTQHGRGVRLRRPHDRAGARQTDCRRQRRHDPQRCSRAGSVFRHRQDLSGACGAGPS